MSSFALDSVSTSAKSICTLHIIKQTQLHTIYACVGVAGTVHEVGHALYEQGRNPNYANLPVSR